MAPPDSDGPAAQLVPLAQAAYPAHTLLFNSYPWWGGGQGESRGPWVGHDLFSLVRAEFNSLLYPLL